MPVMPPWSYTAIDTFDTCPFQYHYKFILKIKDVPTKEMVEGRDAHEALEKRVAANVPLPPQYARYEAMASSIVAAAARDGAEIRTELKVAVNRQLQPCGFFDPEVYGRGALDVTLLTPAQRPSLVFTGDWKTGKTREKDFQLKCFAFFTFVTYPTAERVDCCNLWLPTLKVGQRYRFFREDLPKIWSEMYLKLAAMEKAAADDNYPKRPGPLCSWCPRADCEHNKNPNLVRTK